MLFIQLLVNGVQVGALYALIAVGFSLIFGTTKIFHFAHGATFTLAAYMFYYSYSILELHWILSIFISTLCACLFGIFMDRCIYSPIQRHEGSFFTVFVASLGVGIIVQNVIGIIFGRGFIAVSSEISKSIEVVDGLFLSPISGIAIICSLFLFWVLNIFLNKTNVGIALRALAENNELIRVYGLKPRNFSTLAFVLGSLLVIPAAVLTTMSAGLNPAVGHHIMLISLAATIVGGVGSLKGAAYAGLLLGMGENLALMYFEPQWSEAVTFVLLFLFIIFRPSGFFGQAIKS